jgi:phosphate transport system substrate-binding protein
MPKQPRDPAKSRRALEFFRWALESGRDSAITLNYAPLPPELVRRINSYWKSEFALQRFIGSR